MVGLVALRNISVHNTLNILKHMQQITMASNFLALKHLYLHVQCTASPFLYLDQYRSLLHNHRSLQKLHNNIT